MTLLFHSPQTNHNMAILEDLGLRVKIIVIDSPLQEYEDKGEAPTDDGFGDEICKCQRHVEVVENDEFAVQLDIIKAKNHPNKEKIEFKFALDLDGQEEFEHRLLQSDDPVFLIRGKDGHDGQKLTLRKF